MTCLAILQKIIQHNIENKIRLLRIIIHRYNIIMYQNAIMKPNTLFVPDILLTQTAYAKNSMLSLLTHLSEYMYI